MLSLLDYDLARSAAEGEAPRLSWRRYFLAYRSQAAMTGRKVVTLSACACEPSHSAHVADDGSGFALEADLDHVEG